jgi:predicted Rossmann fold flavoprotein
MSAEVIVVGAGAAGLWAAAVAARGGCDVLVVEKTARAGSKVLASGGTRCNLTTTLGSEEAARLFGPAERFVQPAFRALSPTAVRERFDALGVPTVTEPDLEKVFPASQRALDVRDALLRAALSAGARVRYRAAVTALEPASPGWRVHLGVEVLGCRRLMICPGGASYPRTGTTGDGYGWLRDLGLDVIPPVPALAPLTSCASWVRALTGVSLQDVEVRLHDPSGRIAARRARPVVFTHTGLSGPGAMDLSAPVARAVLEGSVEGWTVALDLLPRIDLDRLRADLADAAGRPGGPHLARVVGEGLPARVLAAVTRQAGLDDDNPALHRVDRRARNRLVDALKGLRVPLSGTLGWDAAEVTAGGLALSEVERTTLRVKRRADLWAFGEILDLTGPIGGLNFQAAFATAELAGRDVLKTRS